MEKEKNIPSPAEETDITPDTVVKFSRSYSFEGKTVSALPDQAVGYVCVIASKISDQPIEFFMGLSPRDMNRVKNKVTGFFYGVE